MAKLQRQASNLKKDQHNLERVKKKAKAVCFTGQGSGRHREDPQSPPDQQGSRLDWSSFAKSVLHQNGGGESMEGQESSVSANATPGWIEERLSFTVQSKTTPIIVQCWSCNRVRYVRMLLGYTFDFPVATTLPAISCLL